MRLAPILLQQMNKFQVVESGGGGYCAVHSLEYLLSGKKNGGKKFMIRYMEWAKEKGYPYPMDSDFRNWASSDWASPVLMFDMLKDMDIDIPFIIHDRRARGGKVYSSEDIYRLLPKREHDKFRNQTGVSLIVGTGIHWMPLVGEERVVCSNLGNMAGRKIKFKIKKTIKKNQAPKISNSGKISMGNFVKGISMVKNPTSIVCM